MNLFNKAINISIKKMLSYHNEVYMVFVNSLLSIITTILFWKIMFSNLTLFNYNQSFIYVLAMIGLISDGISEIFFGFRDLEYLVRDGELDTYLCRPIIPIYLILIERIPMIAIIQKVSIGILGLIYICVEYQIKLSIINIINSGLFMILGVIYYYLVYGMITLLAIWTEKISNIRDLIFQFGDSKKYPITIFPNFLRNLLTYIIPMSLISYYPTIIIMNINENLPKLYFTIPLAIILYILVYKYCIEKYSSNGG